MIISKIQGGLGNQMFQYAYGKHLSSKYNTKLYLDDSFYNYQGLPKRIFSLNQFNIEIDNDLSSIQADIPIYKIDDDFNYKEFSNSSFFSFPIGNYYLDGYWQSEKYFKESEDIIRKDFEPSEELLNKLKQTPLLDTNTISLHIRRTDYTTSNGYHPVQTIEYYKNAIELIGDYDNIFIFSDDIEWCKTNLTFNNMIFMEGFSDIEDLYLMSMCKNNIIANSSFSWWAAWLNNNENKKVIAPINWFGSQANVNTSDIIPDSWIKI